MDTNDKLPNVCNKWKHLHGFKTGAFVGFEITLRTCSAEDAAKYYEIIEKILNSLPYEKL